mgnify:FL=1
MAAWTGEGGCPQSGGTAYWNPEIPFVLPQFLAHVPEYPENVLDEQLVAVLLLSQPNNGRLQLVNGLLELQELCLAVPEFLLLLVKNRIVFLHFLRELLVVLLQSRFHPMDLLLELRNVLLVVALLLLDWGAASSLHFILGVFYVQF